jgi:hypothetical protein
MVRHPSEVVYNNQSFTFYHWNLIEKILTDQCDINELDDEDFEAILYQIMPGGNSALHLMARKPAYLVKLF